MNLINTRKFYSLYRKANPNSILSYTDFSIIIRKLNVKMAIEMCKGNKIKLPHSLGYFEILRIKVPASVLQIDHGQSKINKRKIIENGGTPYETIKDDKGNIIGNNGGQKWLVFFNNEEEFRFNWYKTKNTLMNSNMLKYAAKTVKGFRRNFIAKIPLNLTELEIAQKFNLK